MTQKYQLRIPDDVAQELKDAGEKIGKNPEEVLLGLVRLGLLLKGFAPENVSIMVRYGHDADWQELVP